MIQLLQLLLTGR